MQVPQWAVTFAKYLESVGYENAGLGWGLSHASGLEPQDHDEIIRILTTEYTNESS